MAEKLTFMRLKVDLHCSKCIKKVKKVLCEFPLRAQVFDDKNNIVTITIVCCSPEKIRDEICRKGGDAIKSIEIVKPPKHPEAVDKKKVSDKPKGGGEGEKKKVSDKPKGGGKEDSKKVADKPKGSGEGDRKKVADKPKGGGERDRKKVADKGKDKGKPADKPKNKLADKPAASKQKKDPGPMPLQPPAGMMVKSNTHQPPAGTMVKPKIKIKYEITLEF